MFEKDDIISLVQAAQCAQVTKNAVFAWAAEGLIESELFLGRRIYSKKQMTALLAIRAEHPKKWKAIWRIHQTQRKEDQA